MTYGKGNISSDAQNRHKQMAQGKIDSGAASVDGFKAGNRTQKPSMTGELTDSVRGAGPAIGSGSHGQQAAPDHGDMGKDHHRRGGKL